jgi:hypothetical protein
MSNEKSGIKEIRANRFILEDENGNPRDSLALAKDGRALWLMDEKGKPIWQAP